MTYQKATKMSVKVSMAEKAAKTIQYIHHPFDIFSDVFGPHSLV